MAGFIRRYLFDPGLEELLAIEGVVIIDRDPPAQITGIGTGTVMVVGEFEKGPYETPTEVVGGGDFLATFGAFGFSYDGVPANNPCARTRRADGAITDEHWNGNGFIALVNKKFRRLICTRVDTSVGEVQFTRIACLQGSSFPTFDLEPAQTLDFDIGGGPLAATFTAAAAVRTGGAGVYPTTFTGGEQVTVLIDNGTPNQVGPVQVVFQSTDQTQAQVIARINQFLGYTAAADAGAGTTSLTGRTRGTGGKVTIVSIDAAVATATGMSAGTTAGTGNVVDIDRVTVSEVSARVSAASASVTARRNADGQLELCNSGVPGTGTLAIIGPSTATALGFSVGDSASAASGEDGVIQAGTRVRNAGGTHWVTTNDVTVTAGNAGPYSVKVRPALDDGSAAGSGTGTVTTVVDLVPFAVSNLLPLAAALTESAIDAQYLSALEKTKKLNAVSKETNVIFSARQSNAIRSGLRQNALDASAGGAFGRRAVIRPPLGTTTRAIALSSSQPGVGAYRNQRVGYAFPGVSTYVQQIALRGVGGGAGFTDDGIVDVGFDSWCASTFSQLPPEENPGQLTDFMAGAIGVERGNPDVQDLQMGDYRNFRAGGIMAPNIADGSMVIQSGITSVNPLTHPQLRNQSRRAFADFLQDTISNRLLPFAKQLARQQRRAQVMGELQSFLNSLQSPDSPSLQRLDSFVLDGRSANTIQSLATGIFRIIVKVRMLPSMDVIVLDTEVGENVVTVLEAA